MKQKQVVTAFTPTSKRIFEFLAKTRMMFLYEKYDLFLTSSIVSTSLKIDDKVTKKAIKALDEGRYLTIHKVNKTLIKVTSKNMVRYNKDRPEDT